MYRQESDECVPPHIVMRHENAFWERLFESAGLSYYNHPSWYYMRSGEVMIDEIVTEQERQGLFHDSDAAEIQRAIDSAYEHDNWDDHAAASALYETYDEVYEDDAVEAAIDEQAIADAAAHDADADADDAAAAYYITYVADYDADQRPVTPPPPFPTSPPRTTHMRMLKRQWTPLPPPLLRPRNYE